jgi:hypothetical protein
VARDRRGSPGCVKVLISSSAMPRRSDAVVRGTEIGERSTAIDLWSGAGATVRRGRGCVADRADKRKPRPYTVRIQRGSVGES